MSRAARSYWFCWDCEGCTIRQRSLQSASCRAESLVHQDFRGAGDDVVFQFAHLAVSAAFVQAAGRYVEGRDTQKDVAGFWKVLLRMIEECGAQSLSAAFLRYGNGGDIGRAGQAGRMDEHESAGL